MRKLLVSLTAVCLILAACCGNQTTPATDEAEKGCCKKQEQEGCCKGMTEEQKQACAEFKAKWEDWANQSDESKQDLLGKRRECFDKKMEEMKEHLAQMQARQSEIEAQLANWENLTLDQKKEFFDNYGCCKEKPKCCGEKKEGCPKAKEGCDGHKKAE